MGRESSTSSSPMHSRRLGWCARCACPMLPIMKRTRWMSNGCLTVAAVVACGQLVFADVRVNPYESIAERNPFALKPPLPPAPPEDPSTKTPPVPPATVELTGITSILTSKRALLEIVPGPGKPTIRPILGEGERVESVEVVSINVEKNEVTIKNGNLVTNLTFKVAKSTDKPVTPPGVLPPALGLPGVPPPATAGLLGAGQPAHGNQDTGGRGVQVGGGASSGDGFRSIPPRGIRSNAGQPQQPMTAEQSVFDIERNRVINQGRGLLPPLPPTPLNPNPQEGIIDDTGTKSGWVPRRVAPPLPGQQ
jgi:hypothetical protein